MFYNITYICFSHYIIVVLIHVLTKWLINGVSKSPVSRISPLCGRMGPPKAPSPPESQHFGSERKLWLKGWGPGCGTVCVYGFGDRMEAYVAVPVVPDPHVGGIGLRRAAIAGGAVISLCLKPSRLVPTPKTRTAKRVFESLTESVNYSSNYY